MAEQVGCQSGSRLSVHSHLNISQGGILNEYSRYGAYRRPYRTGALSISCENNTERNSNVSPFVLLKEIRINAAQAGQYQIYWWMKNFDNITNVSAWFCVNGIVISPPFTNNTNADEIKTYNYDVNLAIGDLLQIFGDANGDRIYVSQFRIRYDWRIEYFGDGTSRNLVTALPLTDVDLLDFTNTPGY